MATSVYIGAAHTIVTDRARYQGGVFRRISGDGGWTRLTGGLPEDAEVRAIAVDPRDSRVVFAGTQYGPYRSGDAGETWEAVSFPDRDAVVWSLAFDPRDPRTMYAGTAPTGVYRSRDSGATWSRLAGLRAPARVVMSFPTRVTRIAIDPADPAHIYAALEVDGVTRSLDGGETWEDCGAELARLAERPHLKSRIISDTEAEGMLDSHALCVSAGRPGTVFLAVRMGVFRSPDRGKSWEDLEVGRFSPLTYARDVQASPHHPRTLVACLSPAASSEDGSLYESRDLGESWRRLDHGVKAHQTMMAAVFHPTDSGQLYCATRSQVFGTVDGGESWEDYTLPDDVRAVYAIACA
jgi:photosystem II stability/assembly factor-like uncharacterized protein